MMIPFHCIVCMTSCLSDKSLRCAVITYLRNHFAISLIWGEGKRKEKPILTLNREEKEVILINPQTSSQSRYYSLHFMCEKTKAQRD